MNTLRSIARIGLLVAAVVVLAWSCANRGSGPQGGPKDVAPPVPVSSKPENGALNVKKRNVEIVFDEIVLLENAFEKVVVSPPQSKAAVAKAIGRKVVVELQDTLRDSTTYIIDFADAIVDNNEKNPLLDYYFTFSTGNTIDSLMIGGTVVEANSLNPMAGVAVGIHANLDDSAFTTLPFDYITKTDNDGNFWIKGIRAGTYRIYALSDLNSNYCYDQMGEKLAFSDSLVVPTLDFEEVFDTIWQDSLTIDTIVCHRHPKYTAGIVLRGFEEDNARPQRFIRAERAEKYKLALYFSSAIDSMPIITPLNFALPDDCLIQRNATNDTLTYWFGDTLLWQQDTLSYELTYQMTDSLEQLVWQTDTLNSVYRRPKVKNSDARHNKNENKRKKTEFLAIRSTASSAFDFYNPVKLMFDVPTVYNDTAQLLVEQKIDTVWKPIPAQFNKVDSLGFAYEIDYKWQPENTYRIRIDSTAFMGVNGLHTDKYEATLKIKSLESYATLYVMMAHLEGNEIIELLDKNETVVSALPAQSETVFQNINPGDYYLRLFVDANGNGKWDTGLYAEKRQPEMVYYYQYKLTLRAFWEVEESWDYTALPITQQKPKALVDAAKKKKK